MFEKSHHFQLAKNAFRADQTLKDVGQLLQRDALAVTRVSDGPNDSEGTVADWTVGLVVGVCRRRT